MSIIKKKTIKIPIFFGDLTVIIADGWSEVNAIYAMRNEWPSLLDNGYVGVSFPDHEKSGYTRYVVAFRREPKKKEIAHECVHLVNSLFKDRGLQLCVDNDEAQAYMTGWFFDQIEKFFDGLR